LSFNPQNFEGGIDATSSHSNASDSSKRRKLEQLRWEGRCWPNLERERRVV